MVAMRVSEAPKLAVRMLVEDNARRSERRVGRVGRRVISELACSQWQLVQAREAECMLRQIQRHCTSLQLCRTTESLSY